MTRNVTILARFQARFQASRRGSPARFQVSRRDNSALCTPPYPARCTTLPYYPALVHLPAVHHGAGTLPCWYTTVTDTVLAVYPLHGPVF